MKHSYRILGSLVILTFFISLYAGTTGKIVGTITDANNGEPLIGVNVILEGTTLGATTDLDGTFFILNIPPGTYTLEAQYIGYNTVKVQNVKVNVDLTTEQNLKMQEAVLELSEEIVVIAERELVVKDRTATTATVDAAEFEALPITEISEALALQAGYVDGHVRGGRTSEIAYWIDGMPVTDVYDGGQVVEVNKNMVEQLQLISGAFNAEYGQAMSGIVNITTKEPSENFGGNITMYFGDYWSGNVFDRNKYYQDLDAGANRTIAEDNVFMNLGDFDPTRIANFEGGIYGTIIPNKLSYFANARHIYFGGWQYGQRVFYPQNIAYEDSAGDFVLNRDAGGIGDGKYVPMNWNRKLYLQGKLIYNISPTMKVFYSFIRDDVEFEEYDRNYSLNPDGNLNRFRVGNSHIAKLTHTLNPSTYYDLGFSYFDKSYKQYVYENPHDPRYVHPYINDLQLLNSFKSGGTNMQHFERHTKTALLKFDLTSQISQRHLVKFGIEARQHDIFFDDITLRAVQSDFNPATDDPFVETEIRPVGTAQHAQYKRKPTEFSFYIQDKMEFEDLIVNLGVRMDHFRPDGQILADPSDPNFRSPLKPENIYRDENGNGIYDPGEYILTDADREAYWFKDAANKTQFSPRLGVSFPVTETGVVHFSYGHFFQIPNFELLYRNPHFILGTGTENVGVIGNADLRPEQTISGEIGFQQQIGTELVLDMTAYFRDIRDLAGTRADEIDLGIGGAATYSKIANSDFGFVKGVILSLKKRYSPGINYTLDYTFQVAKGTASDPEQARNARNAAGIQPEVQLIPLNWDQLHTLNATVSYVAQDWGVSLINNLGSGLPYTPRKTDDVSALRENSESKPLNWNIDMRLHKDFRIFDRNLTVFLRVFNLLDRLNETNVYNDTGRANFTTDLQRAIDNNVPENINTVNEWFVNITHFSEPRRIEFGVMFDF